MSIVENILNRFGYVTQSKMKAEITEAVKREIDNLPPWLSETADAMRYNMPDPSIYANQADLYRISPILGTAIEILGNDVGTSKFNVQRMVGEELRDIPNHDFETLMKNPNPFDSGMEFIQATVDSYKLNGNHIWWLNRVDQFSIPDEMWPIPYSMVQAVPDYRMGIEYYKYFPGNGQELRLETWEIVHFKTYNPDNRFVGLSPLESLVQTIRGDLAMRKTNTTNYADHNGAPPSLLAFKDFVPNDTWANIKADKQEAAKQNKMMMLRGVGEGVTWLQRASNNKDMDYVAGLRQNLTDVVNRMCPGLLAMLSENATEANALAARATYSEKALWPMMEVISQKITSDILPAYGRKLIGHFDDPRVVDRKLELEEQTAYERSHTLDETRKKYYQDDPIGDERGEELVAQVGPIAKESNELDSIEAQVSSADPALPAPEIVPGSDTADDLTTKAIRDDLSRWRRKAVRMIGRECPFDTDVIPQGMYNSIKAQLTGCETEEEVRKVFDVQIEQIGSVKSGGAEIAILKGIELGVRALEARR